MWITKDERRLLTIYYLAVNEVAGKVTELKGYSMKKVIVVFQSKDFKIRAKSLLKVDKTLGIPQQENGSDLTTEMVQFVRSMNTIDATNDMLVKRGLINLSQNDSYTIKVSLTIQGYDLGRKYSRKLTSSGLWFKEYKEHWIWFIGSVFGGAFFVWLLSWLSRLLSWLFSVGKNPR
jgi:hypothetical protein